MKKKKIIKSRPHSAVKLGEYKKSFKTNRTLTTDKLVSLSDNNILLKIKKIEGGCPKKFMRERILSRGTIVSVKENSKLYQIINKPSREIPRAKIYESSVSEV